MQGYVMVLGVFVWPIIFTGIIGYVYLKQQSATAAAVVGMILFAAYSNYMVGVETWVNIMYILISLVVTALVLIFISKRR